MKLITGLLFVSLLFSCKSKTQPASQSQLLSNKNFKPLAVVLKDTSSWPYFLQHLPEIEGPVVDYKGQPVGYQQKHFSIINYDVGNRDLQQCADALMRLRAEYLFAQKRFKEIGFHFTGGQYYSFTDYCAGKKPVPKGNDVSFVFSSPQATNHQSLRSYLDIVYTYAGTISLAAELKNADSFTTGSIIITPGSPGHCFIITNEAMEADGKAVFKLVEGYTPAQTIYVLQNLEEPSLGYWHRLQKDAIKTASYEFNNYRLKKFE